MNALNSTICHGGPSRLLLLSICVVSSLTLGQQMPCPPPPQGHAFCDDETYFVATFFRVYDVGDVVGSAYTSGKVLNCSTQNLELRQT